MNRTLANRINGVQVSLGIGALVLGTLVYLISRAPDQTYFVFKSPIDVSLFNYLPDFFGPVGNILPSFTHAFSFIVITAGILSCRQTGCLVICLSWCLVDCAFELGQRFNAWCSMIIPDWFRNVPILENTENYFLQGTFDFADLAAVGLGTATAYFVLLVTTKRSKTS